MTGEYMEFEGPFFSVRSVHIHCCGSSSERMTQVEGERVIEIKCEACRFRVVLSEGDNAEKIDKLTAKGSSR